MEKRGIVSERIEIEIHIRSVFSSRHRKKLKSKELNWKVANRYYSKKWYYTKLSPGVPNFENRKVGRFVTVFNELTKTDLNN